MEIEQLKTDNAKLTERLNNAAKFFREQKAQIDSLTKEKEELEKKFKEQQDFENNTINKVVPELEEKARNLEKENKQLKDQINSLQYNEESDANVINNYAKEVEAYKKEIVNLQGQLIKSNEDLQKKIDQMKTIDLEQKKIIEARDQWMGMAKELEKKVKEFDVAKGEAEIKLETIQKEYEDKFNKQEKEINKLTDHKLAIENDYQELEKANAKLEEAHKLDVKKYEEAEEILKGLDKVKQAYDLLRTFMKVDEGTSNTNSKVTSVNENPMNGQMMRMA